MSMINNNGPRHDFCGILHLTDLNDELSPCKTLFSHRWAKITWLYVKSITVSIYQAFLLMIDRRDLLMFVTKSRQRKLHRYDQIAERQRL